MAILFISDLHLDEARPAATDLFLEFLQTEAARAEALYILGDLFEYWLGDDAPTPAGLRVASGLARLTSAGVPCAFMHGNRDFLVGRKFADQTGVTLLEEEVIVDLYGRPTLLLHGDSLCTDDRAYQEVRQMVRDPQWQADFLARTPRDRARFAVEAREKSVAYQSGASMAIMDVNPDAVVSAFERHGVRHMIHGHTHRPARHVHGLPGGDGERIVLGDWYQQGWLLRVTPEGTDLETLSFPAA